MRRALFTLLLSTTLLCTVTGLASAAPDSTRDAAAPGCTAVMPLAELTGGGPVARDMDQVDVELDETVMISPFRFEVEQTLAAGDAFHCVLTIRSRRAQPAVYELVPLGLVGSKQANAGVEYVVEGDARWGATAGGWITPRLTRLIIPPRGVMRVPFRVTVPADPPPGSASGALGVLSRTRAGAGDTNLGVDSIVAATILLRTDGDAAPDLQLTHVEAPWLRWDREAWPLTADVDNDGDVHAVVDGRVRIRSIFGNEVASLAIAPVRVLPDGREEIDLVWDKVPWLGLYRWDLRVASADGSSTDVVEGWLLALPPWWVLAIVATLLVVLLVGWWRRRGAIEYDDDELSDEESDDDDDELSDDIEQ